jgi:hypothetical protein
VNDLDAVKRIAGMRDVELVFLIPFVKGAKVNDDVLTQGIIGRPNAAARRSASPTRRSSTAPSVLCTANGTLGS